MEKLKQTKARLSYLDDAKIKQSCAVI
jgi:hypothetical protein